MSEEIRCGYSKCGLVIENPRPRQKFCSDAHRVADWRELHIPRCPGCGLALRFDLHAEESAPSPDRTERRRVSA